MRWSRSLLLQVPPALVALLAVIPTTRGYPIGQVCGVLFSQEHYTGQNRSLMVTDQQPPHFYEFYRGSSAGWNATGSFVVREGCTLEACDVAYLNGTCQLFQGGNYTNQLSLLGVTMVKCGCSKEVRVNLVSERDSPPVPAPPREDAPPKVVLNKSVQEFNKERMDLMSLLTRWFDDNVNRSREAAATQDTFRLELVELSRQNAAAQHKFKEVLANLSIQAQETTTATTTTNMPTMTTPPPPTTRSPQGTSSRGPWMATLYEGKSHAAHAGRSLTISGNGISNCVNVVNRQLCDDGNEGSACLALSRSSAINTWNTCVRFYSNDDCRSTPLIEVRPGTPHHHLLGTFGVLDKLRSIGGCPTHNPEFDAQSRVKLYDQSVTSGSISSPNFPNSYNPNENSNWIPTVPHGYRIQITFLDFELETSDNCEYDRVTISELHSERILFQGCSRNPGTILSQDNQVRINFKTDGTVQKRGFALRWTRVE